MAAKASQVILYLSLLHQMQQVANGHQSVWPIKRMTNVTGDILLGALFPIHERDNKVECGRIQDEGVQQLEALLFILHKINGDQRLLPGVRLGVLALDSCDSAAYALEQALDFVKGFVARHDGTGEFACRDGSRPRYREGSFDRVVGIVGGQSSSVSIQLANLMRLFRVPQVSYQSTSPTLSNKEKYAYFFRTVPSDVNQALAILEILQAFKWTYVSVVYSDSDYGNKGYEKLQELAPEDICFTTCQSISSDHFTELDYDTVIDNLLNKTSAKVVVVFADKQMARNVMKAAARRHALRHFVWIGSDAWGGRDNVVEGHQGVAEGAITVSPLVSPLAGFDEHFQSLTPDNNRDENPWFPEFWEEFFHCRLPDFPQTPYNQKFPKWCPERRRISPATGYQQTPALHFVRDAAYAFAHALHRMHADRCGGRPGLCDAMRAVDGAELKTYLEKVNFKDESDKTFRFLPSGDAPPRYSIINFQKVHGTNSYVWRPVGTYSLNEMGEPRLDLDMNAMRFKEDSPAYPRSFCSAPCLPGQAKLQREGETCCWICAKCSAHQYLPDEFHCRDCPPGTLPSISKTSCDPIPEDYLSHGSPWAIGAMAFAGLGMLTTALVAVVFYAYRNTPIIKASGRELSYLLLLGIFLSFGMTFVIVAKPAPCTCALTRFFLGFCYTLCYAAIVTKTSRIARIFSQRREKPCRKPRYTSPRSQLVITALLVSVEGIINTSWLLYDRPAVAHMYPTREENVLICLGSDRSSYLVGLIYPFVLIGFCTVYAFQTRKCPDGFNEARYLTFTNYTTCVIWLAFLPLFVLSTSITIRSVTLSSLLSLSGAVQLACLFVPKVYIALCKPEKNTKESVMCHHNRNSSSAALPSTASTPAILLNGGCKDNYRNSTCSSSSPSSVRNSNVQAAYQHEQNINVYYSPSARQMQKNTCAPNAPPPDGDRENYCNTEQHMTL